jgi:hypothetical protein
VLRPAMVVPALFMLLMWSPVRAQVLSADTASGAATISDDTLTPPPLRFPEEGRREKKSSLTAVGLSAILPGAGQVYTEQYWKVPLILGLGGYWVYEWTRNNDRYREFRDLYSASILTTPSQGNGQFLTLREFYKDQRDSFTWYIGLLYLLNIVDAYVGAELYDFDVGPDLTQGHPGMVASIKFRF